MWDLPLDVLAAAYAILGAYAGLMWLLTPLGRHWIGRQSRFVRRRFIKPERFSTQRGVNWLRGHPWAMHVLLWVPLIGAIIAFLLPLPTQRDLWLGSLCLRLVMAGAVVWLARQTVQTHSELRDSPWVRASRLIDWD